MDSRLLDSLRRILRGETTVGRLLRHETTFKIGGPARILVVPAGCEDLQRLFRWARDWGVPLEVLGGGSNLLALDEGFPGIVLRLGPAFSGMKRKEESLVSVGAAEPLARLVIRAHQWGLSGLEGLTGIPGTVGGSLVMNAGTRMGALGDLVVSARVMDSRGKVSSMSARQMDLGYRRSRFQRRRGLVLGMILRLRPDDRGRIRLRMMRALAERRSRQPLGWPSAGSVFVNPPEAAAGLLIDRAGARGLRYGGAQISALHANFIINRGGARAGDVIWLMRRARYLVWRRHGVALRPEIRLLGGEWDGFLPDLP